MSKEFTSIAKGCVVRATSVDAGYYRINGISMPGYPIFINSVNVAQFDIAAAHSCFNNKHKFYVFGRGFGDITVDIEVFTGNSENPTKLEDRVVQFFRHNRAYYSRRPVIVTSSRNTAYSFFMVSLVVGGMNADTNSMTFRLGGKLVDN